MSENINYRGFDFHCHIDLHPDPPSLIARCEKERIAVLAVTTTPKAWSQNKLWMQHSDYVHAAVGLHPELVGERYGEAGLLEELIGKCRLVGEVGLDGSPQHRSSYEKQKDVFSRVLRTSQSHGGRVLSIHSRRAARDVCDLIEKHSEPDKVLCILHWFSGSLAQSRRAAKAGCFFSVNAAMLKNDRGRALIQDIPSDRLLTETDSPFLSIDRHKSNPLDSIGILTDLAGLLGEEVNVTKQRVTTNALHVFRFAGIDQE